jgi:hypothetical protein
LTTFFLNNFIKKLVNPKVTYMDALDRQVNVVEELVVILDGHAGGEEDHHLLLSVLLQEGEQQQKTLLRRADNVTLKKLV